MDLKHIENFDDEYMWGDKDEPKVPPSQMTSDTVMDVCFHPHQSILAAGLVNGEVEIFKYEGNQIVKVPMQNDISSWIFNLDDTEVVWNQHHNNVCMHPKGGITSMEFTDDGSYLVSGSSDRTLSVLDCASSKLVIHLAADTLADAAAKVTKKKNKLVAFSKKKLTKGKKRVAMKSPNPHKFGISAVNVCDENLVASGDDDGLVCVWDMRQRKPAFTFHEHADYVSQLCYFTDVQELVSSSGDTCIGVYDLRGGQLRDISDKRKDEISCFAFINSTAVNNRSFIPSIIAGTPTGSLPIWKYGSWSRPYDVMESHPMEVESIVSFHGEDTTFNHNIILTGACDGLVRVIQMYPIRRNICQLSARDYTYSHANSLGVGGGAHHQNNSNFVIKRKRGQEAIHKMHVSHDSNVLVVSGPDNILDFVDLSFLNDEKQLDQLRRKSEQRHLQTLRNMEKEVDEKERQEQIFLQELNEKNRKVTEDDDAENEEKSATDSSSVSDSDSSEELKTNSKMEETTPAELRRRIEELQKRRREEKRFKEFEREQEANKSSSDEEAEEKPGKKGKASKTNKKTRFRDYDSSGDSDMFSSDTDFDADSGSDSGTDKTPPENASAVEKKNVKRPREVSKKNPKSSNSVEKHGKGGNQNKVSNQATEPVAEVKEEVKSYRELQRDKVSAARWLKEEKKKKINFKYEKRRRRVGGFFGDMVD